MERGGRRLGIAGGKMAVQIGSNVIRRVLRVGGTMDTGQGIPHEDGKSRRLFHKHASSRVTHSNPFFLQEICHAYGNGQSTFFECVLSQGRAFSECAFSEGKPPLNVPSRKASLDPSLPGRHI